MTIAQDLDDLRGKFDSCELVAFADLDAELVLVSSSKKTARRETLDRICADAKYTLSSKVGRTFGPSDTVVRTYEDRTEIYLRSAPTDPDGLCCICAHDIAMSDFLEAARKMLRKMAGNGEDDA